MDNIEYAVGNDIKLITDLANTYMDGVRKFRGELKNDSASISAASAKLRDEVGRMQKAYAAAIDIWTSDNMCHALKNAQAMADALERISRLQNASITFAVIDRKPVS